MRWVFIAAGLICMLAVQGCRSSSNTAKPPPSYMPQGSQAAAATQVPSVFIRGQVRNQIIPWSDDLTLVRALVAAEYVGNNDPMAIYLHRGSKSIYVSPRRVLSGVYDPQLEPGDVIEIRR